MLVNNIPISDLIDIAKADDAIITELAHEYTISHGLTTEEEIIKMLDKKQHDKYLNVILKRIKSLM